MLDALVDMVAGPYQAENISPEGAKHGISRRVRGTVPDEISGPEGLGSRMQHLLDVDTSEYSLR
jgi:hypothetical protein